MCIRQAKAIGKLKAPSRVQAAADGIPKNKRLAVSDKKDSTTYLIDTGADSITKKNVAGKIHAHRLPIIRSE